jgi:dUTP pyrophosphatase
MATKKLTIGFKKVEGVELPSFATKGSIGFDLKAVSCKSVYSGIREIEEKTREKTLVDNYLMLRPFERALLGTGLFAEIPTGYWIEITGKSGKTLKQGVIVLRGIVDSDYRGEIGIIIQNTSNFLQKIELNQFIAQGIVHKAEIPDFKFVETISETERGEKGFGEQTIINSQKTVIIDIINQEGTEQIELEVVPFINKKKGKCKNCPDELSTEKKDITNNP